MESLRLLMLALARTMARHHIRGGHRLTSWLRQSGWLDQPARYVVGRAAFTVPLKLLAWDRVDVLIYDPATVAECARSVHRLMKNALFVDCGAHIGTFSSLMMAECPQISEIVAVEPNPIWWEWTEANLNVFKIKSTLVRGAVADFRGRGELKAPAHDASAEALYLSPTPAGEIEVFRIDELLPDYRGDLIVKLDIEGGELAALRGASELLGRARSVVAVIEAHPKVSAVTGIDPIECVRFLQAIRPFDVLATPAWVFSADHPGQRVNPAEPFFSQFDPNVYNLVCTSNVRDT